MSPRLHHLQRVLLLLAVVGAFALALHRERAWEQACRASGGQVVRADPQHQHRTHCFVPNLSPTPTQAQGATKP